MADVFSPEKRSAVMAAIRGSGNKSTEERLRRLFREAGITGWRRKHPLPGRPDFAFPKLRIAVFVDGCFWHGCPKCFVPPKSRQDYWEPKIQRNRARDKSVAKELKKRGWKSLRIWEHEFKNPKNLLRKLSPLNSKFELIQIHHEPKS